jgi:hypothetical protein
MRRHPEPWPRTVPLMRRPIRRQGGKGKLSDGHTILSGRARRQRSVTGQLRRGTAPFTTRRLTERLRVVTEVACRVSRPLQTMVLIHLGTGVRISRQGLL